MSCKQCSKRGFRGDAAVARISFTAVGAATGGVEGIKGGALGAGTAATLVFGGRSGDVSGSLLVVEPLPAGRMGLADTTGDRAGAGIQMVSPLPASRVSHSRMLR